MTWITENFCWFLLDIMGSIINIFAEITNLVFFQFIAINGQNQYVVNANKFIIVLSFVLVILLTGKQVLDGYILETNYDSDADPFDLLIRIAEACAVISCSGWLFDYVITMAKKLTSDIVGSVDMTGAYAMFQKLLDIKQEDVGLILPGYTIAMGIMIIAFIVFCVMSLLRGAELIAMKLLFPLFALDLLTTSRERWNNFITGFLIAAFSYGIQILFMMLALKSLTNLSWTNMTYAISSIVWMFMAIKSPKFLEKYIYKSGISKVASGGLRLVAQTAAMRAM